MHASAARKAPSTTKHFITLQLQLDGGRSLLEDERWRWPTKQSTNGCSSRVQAAVNGLGLIYQRPL